MTQRKSASGEIIGDTVHNVAVAFASLATASGQQTNVAVPAAKVGDVVAVSPRTSALAPRVLNYAFCATAGTVSVIAFAGAVTAPAATVSCDIMVRRKGIGS